MRRLSTTTMMVALLAGASLTVGTAANAKAKPKPQAKGGPPTFVVNLKWHMRQTGPDSLDNTSDIEIVNGVFVGDSHGVSTLQYAFGVVTSGTFNVTARESSKCWTQEQSGSGPLTAMLPLELNKNTAIRFFTNKSVRLGLLQPPTDIAVKVTSVMASCDFPVERGPVKVGDLGRATAGIPWAALLCDGLPPVNQGGDTAAPGGVLSKNSPWTFALNCTTTGPPNTDGSVTVGTIIGTVSYTGPTPLPRPWFTAG